MYSQFNLNLRDNPTTTEHFLLFLIYTWTCAAYSLVLFGWNYFLCADDDCMFHPIVVHLVRVMTLLCIGAFLFTSSMLMNVCYGLMTGIGTIDRLKKKATNTMSQSDEEPIPLKDVLTSKHNLLIWSLVGFKVDDEEPNLSLDEEIKISLMRYVRGEDDKSEDDFDQPLRMIMELFRSVFQKEEHNSIRRAIKNSYHLCIHAVSSQPKAVSFCDICFAYTNDGIFTSGWQNKTEASKTVSLAS